MKFLLTLVVVLALVCVAFAQLDKSVCSLPKAKGSCRASQPNYFFNSETKACESFTYGGCNGNDNRFQTQEDCEELCLK